jgi:glycosyltransferase involved in cell wall biosynthesis
MLLSTQTKYPKTKTIFEIHTPIVKTIKTYSPEALEKCDSIFVPSSWSKDTILQLLPSLLSDNIKVIPNIVETSVFNMEGRSFSLPQTMLWVGKLAEYKNWEEAMMVGTIFLQQHPSWNFLAVTGGQNNEDFLVRMLGEFIKYHQIKRFKWLHNLNQSEMSNLYRGVALAGGFLLSTSKAESFCLVIHEAMRCGLPIVSTRIGPIPELIQDKTNGLLYDLGNIQECLEKCNFYLDAGFRNKTVLESCKSLAPYDPSILGESYMKAINCVIAN